MPASRRTRQHGGLLAYWRQLGPGLITGASDNDPSGITTYSVVGATTRYRLLWMAPFTMPFLVAVQTMAARIGVVRREGLGEVIEERYGRPVLTVSLVLLLAANLATIAADVAGIGAGIALLAPVPTRLTIVVVGAGIAAIEVFWSYERFASIVKWTTLVLLLYVVAGIAARPSWGDVVAGTLVPHVSFDHDTLSAMVAVLGTTISPYMFFWITSEEVEEEKGRHQRLTADGDRTLRRDVVTGMGYANLIFYFIVLANAATLGTHHQKIETAAQAAKALDPVVGHYATVLFAVGLIGGGLIAVPVLAGSCAYPLAELMGWNEGLGQRPGRARGFYGTIAVAIAVGVVANFAGIDPVKGLVYAAVLQGVLAPALIVILTLVARDKELMGRWRNGWFENVFGFGAAGLLAVAAVALLVTSLGA
jgi:NRAMP (natural resistance-associated macrophage protein)-like metal ion transporter